MPDEPVSQELLDFVKENEGGEYFLRLSNDYDEEAEIETIYPINIPIISSTWDGIGFISPSPGTEYMLDYTGYSWTIIPPDISESGTFEWDPENLSWSEQ